MTKMDIGVGQHSAACLMIPRSLLLWLQFEGIVDNSKAELDCFR